MTAGTHTRTDPLVHFFVEIDGIEEAVFSEMTGLEFNTHIDPQPEGGRNDHVVSLLGQTKISDITLKNGVTLSTELWDWYHLVVRGPLAWPKTADPNRKMRRNLSIIMVDQTGKKRLRWDLAEALPIKWQASTFDASQSRAMVQTLTLNHRGLIFRRNPKDFDE